MANKNGKYQVLKITWSYYIIILLKSWKSLELASSLNNRTKNTCKMPVVRKTNIRANLVLILHRIQTVTVQWKGGTVKWKGGVSIGVLLKLERTISF